MDLEEFERLAEEAVETLPEEFRQHVRNCMLLIEPLASKALRRRMHLKPGEDLLGLYEGVSLPRRSRDQVLEIPPRITLFYEPILARCRTEKEIRKQIRRTMLHEIGHHFGMSEEQLDDAGYG